MSRYAKLAREEVPQSEPLNSRQVQNNAGGFVFQIDDWGRLSRFLVLGSDAPTYYQSAKKLTRENAACVQRCYDADFIRTVSEIVLISHEGRAPKNDAAIFALAVGAAHKQVNVRRHSLANMWHVCRTSTHLFQFLACVKALGRGGGRTLKRAVQQWYNKKQIDKVAFQMIKYREREGYTHGGVMKLFHPAADTMDRVALYRWARGLDQSGAEFRQLPELIAAHLEAMKLDVETKKSKKELLALIEKHNLPWEAIPTSVTKDPDIWRVMLPTMGMTALIRNLGGMTQYGTLAPLSEDLKLVTRRLGDLEELRKARIHPFNLLVARAVYARGASMQGGRTWKPIPQIVDALEDAFYLSFKTIKPSGKRTLIGIDISGSMSNQLMNSPISACEGATAMAMTTARTEEQYYLMGFAHRFRDLNITANDTLEAATRKTRDQNFGSTDCALPMIHADKNQLPVDTFVVYTDNETWAGRVHPPKALQDYRQHSGIPAKLIVVGMTSTGFSIADPEDAGMLDVVGFDSAAPGVIANFSAGRDEAVGAAEIDASED